VLVAIVLTPALCATMLKPSHKASITASARLLRLVQPHLRCGQPRLPGHRRRMLRAAGASSRSIAAARRSPWAWLYLRVPSSFLPDEDQGMLFTIVQTPVGATQERTQKVMSRSSSIISEKEKEHIESVFAVQGFSFAAAARTTAWPS
jgi:multidrug efflux pump subunit AcrB